MHQIIPLSRLTTRPGRQLHRQMLYRKLRVFLCQEGSFTDNWSFDSQQGEAVHCGTQHPSVQIVSLGLGTLNLPFSGKYMLVYATNLSVRVGREIATPQHSLSVSDDNNKPCTHFIVKESDLDV
jgi:hypothetical protein